LKRKSTATGFLFCIFDLEYFIGVQSSEPLHGKMIPTSCLFRSRFACAPKMRERHQLFLRLRLVSKEFNHPALQTKIEQHFGGFFHSSPANMNKGFYANHDPYKQEVGFIFA
jgi:hypothetical protein